jgi:hypothetical protein
VAPRLPVFTLRRASLHISCIDELYGFGTGCSVFIARDDVKAGAFLRLKVVMKSIDA